MECDNPSSVKQTTPRDQSPAIAVIGNISYDTAFYGTAPGAPGQSFWGGAGLHVALTLAQYGGYPSLISVIARQDAHLVSRLSAWMNTETIAIRTGDPCQFSLFYDDQGRLQRLRGTSGVADYLETHVAMLDLYVPYYHVCCRLPFRPAQTLARLVQARIPFSVDFIVSSAEQQIRWCSPWLHEAFCIFVNHQEYIIRESQ